MTGAILLTLTGFAVLIGLAFMFAACQVSGDADEQMEKWMQELEDKKDRH